jgi:hypothetical protein
MQANTRTTSLLPRRNWLARSIGALLIASTLAFAPHADARVYVSVNIAPPLLPVYVQPPIPGPGYIWAPGYWAWDDYYGDYYWVPGCWVRPPYVGALWTPSYWAWDDGAYVYYPGYWGLTVGYYGGIDYGFGYGGIGYYGGYWNNNIFYYNKTVNNITINSNVTNVYTGSPPAGATVTTSRASFTGPNGVNHLPTQAELANSRQAHTDPVAAQTRQQALASHDTSLRASANHGSPPIAATTRAGSFENAQRSSAAAAMTTGSNRREMSAPGRNGPPDTGFVHHRNAVQSNAGAPMHERPTSGMERTPRTVESHNAEIRSMQEMRTNNAHSARESINGRPFVEHRQPPARMNENPRFSSSTPSTPPMRQERQITRNEGPREMPSIHQERQAPRDMGPREMPPMQHARQMARNAGPREMPPMRPMEGPRSNGTREAPPQNAPRGQRQPSDSKQKDKEQDRHGG